MFNTLKYAKMLEEVGFSKDQAETSINILVEIMEDKLATKQDLQELRNDIRNTLGRLEAKIEHAVAQVESKLTIRMGTMLAASIAILTAIQKFV